MKVFKLTLPLVAFVLAIAASAFTALPVQEVTTDAVFFDYVGTDQMDQNSYQRRTTQPNPGPVCPGEVTLCGIWAQEDPNDTDLPLQSDIDALKASHDANNDDVFDGESLNEIDFKQ